LSSGRSAIRGACCSPPAVLGTAMSPTAERPMPDTEARMNMWEYLARRQELSIEAYKARAKVRASAPTFWQRVLPAEFRGWLGLALFLQSTFLFSLLAIIPKL